VPSLGGDAGDFGPRCGREVLSPGLSAIQSAISAPGRGAGILSVINLINHLPGRDDDYERAELERIARAGRRLIAISSL